MSTNVQAINSASGASGATVQQETANFAQLQYKTNPIPSDKFEKKEGKKGFTGLEEFLGVTTVGLGIATAVCSKKLSGISKSLGNCLKRLGKDIPNDLDGKLSTLTKTALRDNLTGLYNRACMDSFVEKSFKEAKAEGKNLAVGFIDMDNFKNINEVFDHDTGDKVLQAMSKNIQKVSDKYKVKCFRYGGEEFVIVAPGHDAKSVQKILIEINDEIKQDKYIQGLSPEFLSKSNDDIDFLSDVKKRLDSAVPGSIFARLKESRTQEQNIQLKNEIVDLVQKYVGKYQLEDNKKHSAIIEKLTNTTDENLASVLNVDSKINDDLTLGNALDEIYTPSKDRLPYLIKGKMHVDKHKCFTCSGGGVDLGSKTGIKSGADMVGLSDNKGKTAKSNGKNTILI